MICKTFFRTKEIGIEFGKALFKAVSGEHENQAGLTVEERN
jgi:hypothetical protein